MPDALLSSIEWHHLPVSAIRIEESGLSLVVTPYNALADAYDTRILRITDAEHVGIRITGTLSAEDFRSMEVSKFDYSIGPSGRITGTLGLLPGEAGYWELSFTNAHWELVDA
ncbi:MAG: hypothetical protein ACTHOH_08115 [Lysobacteraceae bacterium]